MTSIFADTSTLFSGLGPMPTQKAASGQGPTTTSFLNQLQSAAQVSTDSAGKWANLPPIAGSDYGIYANVVVGGKVVASISNSGCALVADGYGGENLADMLDMPGDGPKLAQQRAEKIAQELGGEVVIQSTAVPPEKWTGKRMGAIDLWGLDGKGPDYRPPAAAPNPLLLAQEENTGRT